MTTGRGTQGFCNSSQAGPVSQALRLLEGAIVYQTPVWATWSHIPQIFTERLPASSRGPAPG